MRSAGRAWHNLVTSNQRRVIGDQGAVGFICESSFFGFITPTCQKKEKSPDVRSSWMLSGRDTADGTRAIGKERAREFGCLDIYFTLVAGFGTIVTSDNGQRHKRDLRQLWSRSTPRWLVKLSTHIVQDWQASVLFCKRWSRCASPPPPQPTPPEGQMCLMLSLKPSSPADRKHRFLHKCNPLLHRQSFWKMQRSCAYARAGGGE